MLVVNKDLDRDEKKPIRCVLCSGHHRLNECQTYLNKTVNQRWDMVKQNKLCFSCLLKGHGIYQCKKKRVCRVDGCRKVHHLSLHDNVRTEPTNSGERSEQEQVNSIHKAQFNPKSTKLLFKVLPIELQGENKKIIRTFALIDEGSSCSLVKKDIAEQLSKLNNFSTLTLKWFGGQETEVSSMSVTLNIRGVNSTKWLPFNARTVPSLKLPMQTINLSELHQKYQQLKHLPIAEYMNAEPMVLIGIDNCHLLTNNKSTLCRQDIIATKTPLGWAIYGQLDGAKTIPDSTLSVSLHISTEQKLDPIQDIVSDYFSTENFGVVIPKHHLESEVIKRAKCILNDTTKRIGENYECGLLWKTNDIVLPDSFYMARNRFNSVEKKMKADPEFAQAFRTAMAAFFKSGYARRLNDEEVKKVSPTTWYLPHFAVFNANKPGKLRLVFDAAAAVQGKSLNSVLLKGPDETQSLIKILLQFREGVVGVCADIKEMFLQVKIRKEDQNSQRFLWRDDFNGKLEICVMTSMIFGATCSPCIAQHVKNKNAYDTARDQPEVINAIVNNHYVDDFVCSFRDEEEALRISNGIVETHLKAGFVLRGFISNSARVQQQLNKEDSLNRFLVNMNSTERLDKILGMYWSSQCDGFMFQLKLNRVDPRLMTGKICPTKRQFLSLVMSVYDPLGFIADVLIHGKILLQSLWRKNIAWDDEIPPDIFKRFAQWVVQLTLVQQLKIPRCYAPEFLCNESTVELHVFVDASEQAFAAVAYWRVLNHKETRVSFIMGKTRCAPLKLLSVPRLELQAAVLGTRLMTAILESHTIKPSRTVLWSDSKTVINWIHADHRQYKPFVAHRVGEILDVTHENDWRWLPTNVNVADRATRAIYPPPSSVNHQWIDGPEFLMQPEEKWPTLRNILITPESDEEKRKCLLLTAHEQTIDFSRFSNYLRLTRTIGYILRFITATRTNQQNSPTSDALTIEELRDAELCLCKIVQKESFGDEIRQLKSKGVVSKGSDIYKLTPQLNADGVICVQGRLDYATVLQPTTRRPLILPHRHKVTEILVKWYHERFYHQNIELVVNEVRKKFWVPHLRAAVKRAQSKCQQCKNRTAKPRPPLMGQLPIDRLTPYIRPFTFTGLDYFGPMYVTIGRRTEKRWAALFTCLTVRAVHIELAHDLSTDACILCIRNFVNRRGIPTKIRSDMGTNFVGADGELRRVTDLFDMNYLQNELSTKGIKWEFNCPANPSSGGCWERLIQSTKKVLAVTLKEKAPQVETLRSLLIEAESILNSRPLTHLPVTPEEPDPLTPNHFLLGCVNSTQGVSTEEHIGTRKQYRISQQLKNQFWRRWVREYMPTLTRRTKWFQPQKPISPGDVVIICDETLPRSEWKKGVVVTVTKAKDGVARLAEVRTSNAILRRPVSRLAVLDVLK